MKHLLFRERCVRGSRILKNRIVITWSIDIFVDHNQKEETLIALGRSKENSGSMLHKFSRNELNYALHEAKKVLAMCVINARSEMINLK